MSMTIYSRLDKLLPGTKKALRREFNRLSVMGFDELNVLNTKKVTKGISIAGTLRIDLHLKELKNKVFAWKSEK